MLARHPLAERLAGMLMTAWYRSGRQAEALQVFRDLRDRLVRELGVEPGDELQRLHQRLLSGDPAGSAGAVCPDGTIPLLLDRQLGQKHTTSGNGAVSAGTASGRVVDAESGHGSRTVHQQTSTRYAAQVPPPDNAEACQRGAPDATTVVPRQLPAAPAHFAGRQQELTSLTGRLGASAGGGLTIVAISGIPGVGKTALALHWAHQVQQRFPDGQLYVNLRGFDASPARSHLPKRSAGSWSARVCTLARSRLGWMPGRPCTAVCWPTSECLSCWTTHETKRRSGRCCPVLRRAWSW